MKKRFLVLAAGLLSIFVSAACSEPAAEMHNGYYSAEAEAFDSYGWKEFITIHVSDNKIVTVEYDARNESGFIKSWDIGYMRNMQAADGTYPNEYTRVYGVSLLNWQNPADVDALSGATHSYHSFQLLASAAIAQAKTGHKQVVQVKIPEVE